MTAVDVLTIAFYTVFGGLAGYGAARLFRLARVELHVKRALRRRRKALEQPFVASNQHCVYVAACDCANPNCTSQTVFVSTPAGERSEVMLDLPRIGSEASAASGLRALADQPQICDEHRPPVLAAAEFMDSLAAAQLRRAR